MHIEDVWKYFSNYLETDLAVLMLNRLDSINPYEVWER